MQGWLVGPRERVVETLSSLFAMVAGKVIAFCCLQVHYASLLHVIVTRPCLLSRPKKKMWIKLTIFPISTLWEDAHSHWPVI